MELAEGNIAVVTGAASGIGLALAERFARVGLDVVLADVDEDGLAGAAEVIRAHGVDTLVAPTDVSVEASVRALAGPPWTGSVPSTSFAITPAWQRRPTLGSGRCRPGSG